MTESSFLQEHPPAAPVRGPSMPVRVASRLVLGLVAAFLALEIAAMALYPGGTWLDRSTIGYDFFRNFFCDLTAPRALNDQANPGAPLGTAAIVLMGLALAPFWFLVTHRLRAHRPFSLTMRWLGFASAAAVVAVPLLPSQRYGLLHAAVIFVAGAPGLLAAVLATIGLLRTKGARLSGGVAALTLLLAAIDGALYTCHVVSGEEIRSALLPTLQKLAAMALVAWMVATGVEASR
jgi:hypothetical protein